jgi:LSD1 subclass zinc finger protein
MEHSNPAVQYMALSVLEHCIQNSNSTFHEDLAADKAMHALIVKAGVSHAAHPTVIKVKELAARIALDLSRTFEHDEEFHVLANMHRDIQNSAATAVGPTGATLQQGGNFPAYVPTPQQYVPPPRQDGAEMECGFCDVRLSFPSNARKVRCGNCQQVNRVTRTVQCGACSTLNEVLLTLHQFSCGNCGVINATAPPQQQQQQAPPQPQPWECPQCTFINPGNRQYQCSQCDYKRQEPAVQRSPTPPPEPVVPWQCSVCTYQCTRNKITCEMCGAHKAGPVPITTPMAPPPPVAHVPAALPPPTDPWTCGTCTYVNNTARPNCELCSNPRVGLVSAPALAPPPIPAGPWDCAACTFKNSGVTLSACEICGTARDPPKH